MLGGAAGGALAAVAGRLTLTVVALLWHARTSAYEVRTADDPCDDQLWQECRLVRLPWHSPTYRTRGVHGGHAYRQRSRPVGRRSAAQQEQAQAVVWGDIISMKEGAEATYSEQATALPMRHLSGKLGKTAYLVAPVLRESLEYAPSLAVYR